MAVAVTSPGGVGVSGGISTGMVAVKVGVGVPKVTSGGVAVGVGVSTVGVKVKVGVGVTGVAVGVFEAVGVGVGVAGSCGTRRF